MRKIQIGVMGSMSDLKYSKNIEKIALDVGRWVAKSGATLIFGAEKDADSLSTVAAKGAKIAGGLTVGVTYGKGLDIQYPDVADVIIASGLERGGGRETALVLSCDAVITIGGGSGTLNEIAVAYQANIPIVAISNTGGWSDELSGRFLDERRRLKVETAPDAKAAVELAIKVVNNRSVAAACALIPNT